MMNLKPRLARGAIYSTCIFAMGLLFADLIGWDLRTGLSSIDPVHLLVIAAAGMMIGWRT